MLLILFYIMLFFIVNITVVFVWLLYVTCMCLSVVSIYICIAYTSQAPFYFYHTMKFKPFPDIF